MAGVFFARRRRFDAGILGVFQGKSEKYGGKRSASGRFDNFQTSPSVPSYTTFGFPGDKPAKSMWETSGSFYGYYDLNLYFSGYSANGQSGSPVVQNDDTSHAVGILAGSNAITDDYDVTNYLVCSVGITSDIIKTILQNMAP